MKGKKYGLQPVKKESLFENIQEKQMLADQKEYDKQQMARLVAEQRAQDAQKRAERAKEAQLDAESRERDERCEKNELKRNLGDLKAAVIAKGLKPEQILLDHKRQQQEAEIFKKREEERQLRERIKQQAAEKDTQQAQSRERRGPGLSR